MKVRVMVEMLAVVVALFLAFGVSDGLVINKCELRDELNSTLPEKMLDKITNLVAKIVCHADLSSHLNTSTIKYITGPNIKKFIQIQDPKGNSSTTTEGRRGRKGNSSTTTAGSKGRKGRSVRSRSEVSSEEDIQGPKSNFNSSTVNPVTLPKGNSSTITAGSKGRKGRSLKSSSEESSEEDIRGPKSNFNSSMVNPVTLPKGNSSAITEHPRGRKSRSAESSSEESDEQTIWTLYGLFQLPNRIACTSGFEPSLNLCKMDCDSLIDDNIRDDISCVETILNKMLSAENSNGPTEELFHKLSADFFQKTCIKEENSKYFSTC
ncbi:uncharacterized protein LOC113537617 isoform X2 [Tachysurus ichikawai]